MDIELTSTIVNLNSKYLAKEDLINPHNLLAPFQRWHTNHFQNLIVLLFDLIVMYIFLYVFVQLTHWPKRFQNKKNKIKNLCSFLLVEKLNH